MDEESTFEGLVEIMDRLRDPGGCPWDREQSYETLRSYLLEECYEVVDALDRNDAASLQEELGDLLFQIVFLSRLAREQGRFSAADVVRGIAAKIVRRHPHVFGDARADTSQEVLRSWEEIKRREKERTYGEEAPRASVLSGIPPVLPALLKAQRLGTKAARVGFDWPDAAAVLGKVEEEMEELRRAIGSGDPSAAREEIGDVLFTLAMLARHAGTDPEAALERTNLKFRTRFEAIEEELDRRGMRVDEAGFDLLDQLWNEVKQQDRSGP